jgi:molybdate transport system substrate-binding protein
MTTNRRSLFGFRSSFFLTTISVGGLCLVGCGTADDTALLVAAAVSLTEALEEIGPAYEMVSGVPVKFSFGASNALARQIAAGAPADVFISADEARMTSATQGGAIDATTIVPVVGNELAVVVSDGVAHPPRNPTDLLAASIRRVAMGEPNAVPAGVYARQHFERIGLWETLLPKVVPTGSVRAALAAVSSGAADAAVVYRSDLVHATGVRLAFAIPRASGPRIVYPAAVTQRTRRARTARDFLAFLQRDEAQRVFARHGFVPLGGT